MFYLIFPSVCFLYIKNKKKKKLFPTCSLSRVANEIKKNTKTRIIESRTRGGSASCGNEIKPIAILLDFLELD